MKTQLYLSIPDFENFSKNSDDTHMNLKGLNYHLWEKINAQKAQQDGKNTITCNKKLFADCIKNFKHSFPIFANVYENVEKQIYKQQQIHTCNIKTIKNEIAKETISELLNTDIPDYVRYFFNIENDNNDLYLYTKHDINNYIIHWDKPILIENQNNNTQQNSLLAVQLFAKYFAIPMLVIDCNDINLYSTLFGNNISKSKILQTIDTFKISNLIIVLTNFNHITKHIYSESIIQKLGNLFDVNCFDRSIFIDSISEDNEAKSIALTNWVLMQDENENSILNNAVFPQDFNKFFSISSIQNNQFSNKFLNNSLRKEIQMLEQQLDIYNHRINNADVGNNDEKQHSDYIALCDPQKYKKFLKELEKSNADSRTALREELDNCDVENEKHYITLLPKNWESKLKILRKKFPNFNNVVDYLYSQFKTQEITDNYLKFAPFIIVGPSGCGKTEFAVEFAKLFFPVNQLFKIAQMEAGFVLLGSGKHWGNSQAGLVFRTMFFSPELNPCFILDNVDHCGGDDRFPVANAVANLLNASESKTIIDNCADIEMKGHFINYIATANKIAKVKPEIRDKMKKIDVNMPTTEENKQIAKQIYIDLHNKKNYKDPTYFSQPLSNEILSELSKVNPAQSKKILDDAIANAIKNNRYQIDITDINKKDIDLYASARLDETLEENQNLKDFELFSPVKLDNLQRKVSNNLANKSYVDTMEEVFDKMLADNEYKLRQLPKNWREIMQEFNLLFPNFKEFADYICCQFAANEKGHNTTYWEPVLFTGEAGIGKTEAAKWLANHLNVPYEKIDMQNNNCTDKLVGNSKNSGSNAQPGKFFEILVYQPISNPIILLDELEKTADEKAMNCLYTLTEKSSAKEYKDEFVDSLSLNAEYISFIATTNSIDKISTPLLTRFKVFEIKKPTVEQSKVIAQNIYAKIIKDNGYKDNFMNKPLTEEMLNKLSNVIPREMLKTLKTLIGKVALDDRDNFDISDFENIGKQENSKMGFY